MLASTDPLQARKLKHLALRSFLPRSRADTWQLKTRSDSRACTGNHSVISKYTHKCVGTERDVSKVWQSLLQQAKSPSPWVSHHAGPHPPKGPMTLTGSPNLWPAAPWGCIPATPGPHHIPTPKPGVSLEDPVPFLLLSRARSVPMDKLVGRWGCSH